MLGNNDFFFGGSAPPKQNDNTKRIEQIKDSISKLEHAKNDIDKNVQKCMDEINADCEALIASVNDRKRVLLDKLNHVAQTKQTALSEEISRMQTLVSASSSSQATKLPTQRELDVAVNKYRPEQTEMFYIHHSDRLQLMALMSAYGDISLPLAKANILFARNDGRNFGIAFRWNLTVSPSEKHLLRVTQVRVAWTNVDDRDDKKEQLVTMEVEPCDSNIYQHTLNVAQNGTYSFSIQYFESNLRVWSKPSDVKVASVRRIQEEFVAFDVFDADYIAVASVNGQHLVTGNGAKKGKYARMVCSTQCFTSDIHEWRIQCVEYDSWSQAGNASHAVGVMTDAQVAKNGANWVNDARIQWAYYWNSYRRCIYGACNGEYVFEHNVNDGWKTGDVITVVLDCTHNNIRFLKNGQSVHENPFKIEENQAYHPLVVMRSHNDQYQVLK